MQPENDSPLPEEQAEVPQMPSLTDQLLVEIAQLKEQLEQQKQAMYRYAADAENTRKRAEKHIEDSVKYAVTNFAKDLINVMENLHRTLQAIPGGELEAAPLLKSMYEGVDMTQRELGVVFDRYGVARINPELGEPFDHNFHQAVAQLPTGAHPPGSVAQVMQAGYKIHDRLLRPAMVAVAKAEE